MSINLSHEEISSFINTFETEVRCHAFSEDLDERDVNIFYQKIHSLFLTAQSLIQNGMQSCTHEGRILEEKEVEYLSLTSLSEKIETLFKQTCHDIRTHHPVYPFHSDDRLVCNEQNPLKDLIEKDTSYHFVISDARLDVNSSTYREIMGDGNCFFHALATSLIGSKNIGCIAEKIAEIPFNSEFLDKLSYFLSCAHDNPEAALVDTDKMMKLVRALREISYHELLTHPNKELLRSQIIAEFEEESEALSTLPIDTVIVNYTRQMGKEACHPVIESLCRALKINVKIFDRSTQNITEIGESCSPESTIRVVLSAQHYFLIESKAPTPIKIQAIYQGEGELFIRGSEGSILLSSDHKDPLSWDRSIPMRRISENTWEADALGAKEIKFLLNGSIWSNGDNIKISTLSATTPFTPNFG